MKAKRFISLFLATSFIFAALPETAAAAGSSKVTDVNTAKGWDALRTRYITYTINGVKYDSREMGTGTNAAAFDAMNDADKEKVARWMAGAWPSNRERQFGYNGAENIIDKYNDVTGWKALWAETAKKLENYYGGDLLYVYGGPSTAEPDKYYIKEYDKLTVYPEDSSAYKLLNSPEYLETYQARDFYDKYNYISELMQEGHEHYKMLSVNMRMATEAAVKGSSKELISIICDKMMVPVITPRSMFSTIEKEIFSGVLEITDRMTGLSGKIQDIALNNTVSGSKAAELVTYFKAIADGNYEAAKLCHEKAVSLHNDLEKEAASIIKKIDKERAHRCENGRDGEIDAYWENLEAVERARNNAIENVAANTSDANAVAAMFPKDGDEDYYEKREKALEALEALRKKILKDISSCGKTLNDNARTILDEAGLLGLKTGTEVTDEMKLEYPGVYFIDITEDSGIEDNGIEYVTSVLTFDIKDYPAAPAAQQLVGERSDPYMGGEYDGEIIDVMDDAGLAELEYQKYKYLEWLKKQQKMYQVGVDLAPAFEEKTQAYYLNIGARIKGWNVVSERTELFPTMGSWHIGRSGRANPAPFFAESMVSSISKTPDLWFIDQCIADIELNYAWTCEQREKDLAKKKKFEEAANTYAQDYKARYQRWLDGEQAKIDYLKGGLPDYVYIQANGDNGVSNDTVRLYDDDGEITPFAASADKLKGLTPAEYSALADECRQAYEQYYALEDAAEAAELAFTQANVMFEYVYSNQPGGFSYTEEIRAERENAGKIWGSDQFELTNGDRKILYLLPLMWRDFDTKSTCKLELKKQVERLENESGNIKRAAASRQYNKNVFENLYLSGLNEAIDNAKNCSYVPTIMIDDGKVTDLEAQANATAADINAVFDDLSSYTPAEGITTSSSTNISLAGGKSAVLSASVYPAHASNTRIIWESLDPDIATVDENGKVTAISSGTARIRAYPYDSEMELITSLDGSDYAAFPNVYEPLPQYVTEFTVIADGGDPFIYGDVSADNTLAADDAAMILQKVLVDSYKMPIEDKTDNWLKYADTTADGILAADDATAVMQKVLVDSYTMPCEAH